MMELIRAGDFCVAGFGREVAVMRMVRDITEVIAYVGIMGFVGCAVAIGMMSCMI